MVPLLPALAQCAGVSRYVCAIGMHDCLAAPCQRSARSFQATGAFTAIMLPCLLLTEPPVAGLQVWPPLPASAGAANW